MLIIYCPKLPQRSKLSEEFWTRIVLRVVGGGQEMKWIFRLFSMSWTRGWRDEKGKSFEEVEVEEEGKWTLWSEWMLASSLVRIYYPRNHFDNTTHTLITLGLANVNGPLTIIWLVPWCQPPTNSQTNKRWRRTRATRTRTIESSALVCESMENK